MLPTLESRFFNPTEREQAVEWAGEAPIALPNATASIRMVKTTKDEVIAFEIDGAITSEAIAPVIDDFQARLAAHDKVRLLANIKHLNGFDPSILMQSGFLSMKLGALKKLERYAIVGAPGWLKKIIAAIGSELPGIEMRAFAADQQADAWSWVDAQRA